MDSFDRHSRRHVNEKMATDENRGYGPSRRGRGSLGVGLVAIVVFVIAVLIVDSGCSTVRTMAPIVAPDTVDGLCIELVLSTADGRDPSEAELERTRSIIESRVDATGLADAVVRAVEPDGLEIVLPFVEPGSEDADLFRDLISTVGILEFMPVPSALAQEALEKGPLSVSRCPGRTSHRRR